MNNHKPLIVGIGELLWDVFKNGKRIGGAPVNLVYNATQLGAEGYAVTAVGNDEAGSELLRELKKSHIDSEQIQFVDYATGHSIVDDSNPEDPTYNLTDGAAWDHIPTTVESINMAKQADALCFGTLALRNEESRNTIFTLLSYARKDALLFFDINLRQNFYSTELIEQLLCKANVFKTNREELATLCRIFGLKGDEDEVCRMLLRKYGLKYIILTAGADYSKIYAGDRCSRIDTPDTRVVDTVGGGDAFSGAFIVALLNGASLEEAHRCAVIRAKTVCEGSGAWVPCTEEELKSMA